MTGTHFELDIHVPSFVQCILRVFLARVNLLVCSLVPSLQWYLQAIPGKNLLSFPPIQAWLLGMATEFNGISGGAHVWTQNACWTDHLPSSSHMIDVSLPLSFAFCTHWNEQVDPKLWPFGHSVENEKDINVIRYYY